MPDAKTREEVIAISAKVADEWGIPRALLLACGIAESNLRWDARRPVSADQDAAFWPDVSGGAWQQTVLYDPDYAGGQGYPGPAETERILEKQYDVSRSAHVAAANLKRKFRGDPDSDADILQALAQYNWPAGDGKFYTPEHEANYRRGLAEAKTILGAPVPKVTYDPTTPAIAQDDDWSCAPTSLRWALTALGRMPGPQYIENLLVRDGVVSRSQGLLDASGAQLAAWVGRTGLEYYGSEGFYANSEPSVTFDGLALEGDHAYPLLTGGRAWNHWTGVRGYDKARDLLLLANPSEGWGGVYQTMSREQFSALGPFSMVRVLHDDLLEAPAPQPSRPAVLIQEIRERLEELERLTV